MIAGNHGLQLRWVAPPSCPSQEEVRAQINRYLQPHKLDDGGPTSRQATVTLRERGGSWKALINTHSAYVTGERTLKGASCNEVASAAALILAMLVDPEAVRGANAGSAQSIANTEREQETAGTLRKDVQAAMAVPPAAKVPSRHWQVGMSALAGAGLLPGIATGLGLRSGWMNTDWALGLTARAWRQASETLSFDGQAGGTFGAYELGLRLWRTVVDWPHAKLRGGGGLDGSAIRGAGYGISDPARATALGFDLALGGEVGFYVATNLALWLGAEGLVPTYRPRFVLEGRGQVWRREAAAVVLNFSVDYRF